MWLTLADADGWETSVSARGNRTKRTGRSRGGPRGQVMGGRARGGASGGRLSQQSKSMPAGWPRRWWGPTGWRGDGPAAVEVCKGLGRWRTPETMKQAVSVCNERSGQCARETGRVGLRLMWEGWLGMNGWRRIAVCPPYLRRTPSAFSSSLPLGSGLQNTERVSFEASRRGLAFTLAQVGEPGGGRARGSRERASRR